MKWLEAGDLELVADASVEQLGVDLMGVGALRLEVEPLGSRGSWMAGEAETAHVVLLHGSRTRTATQRLEPVSTRF